MSKPVPRPPKQDPKPSLLDDERRYGHRRDGSECVYEVCGTSPYDPCTYTPEEIERFEREAEEEWIARLNTTP